MNFVNTPASCVCKPKRRANNKVFKGIATTRKSVTGFFHGFKLYIIIIIIINDKAKSCERDKIVNMQLSNKKLVNRGVKMIVDELNID